MTEIVPHDPPGRSGSPPAGVAAVWCDFGGVLTSSISRAYDRVVRAAGVPPEVLRAAFDHVAAEYGLSMVEPLELGLVSQREWGDRVAAVLRPTWTPAVDLGRFGDYFYAGRTANLDLLWELARLRSTGIRVGMLTNSVREWEPLRRALLPDAADVFESRIASHEAGVRKPDAAMFELAERTFGHVGPRCLLIDDAAENCAAAASLGWVVVHHQSTSATSKALTSLLPSPM